MAQALAQLAGEVYSSTDVGFPLAPGSSALLPNGYQQLAESIEVPPQEVLLYLAVRESALIRLHKANPWLREDLVQLVARYARGIRVDMNRMQDAASQVDMSNPDAVQEAFEGGMFSPQRTEDQELAVQRLEGLLALIEGWVSVVTEDATRNLPKAPQLTEIMARRRIDGGPSEQVFENLVGLELRPRLVREAQQFWRWYEESHGMSTRRPLGHPGDPAHPRRAGRLHRIRCAHERNQPGRRGLRLGAAEAAGRRLRRRARRKVELSEVKLSKVKLSGESK